MALVASISITLTSVTYPDTFGGEIDYGDVYINITDSVTGLPANGNNLIVSYTDSIDGAKTATVLGQNLLIYSGLLNETHYDPTGTQIPPNTSRTFAITGTTAGTGTVPPDDLEVIYFSILSSESAAGAHDGAFAIGAVSSYYTGVQYSLDGITYQIGNTFAGLATGNYTAYIKDSFGTVITKLVFIPIKYNILISGPGVSMGSTYISSWNAAFNPIYFIYQRKDALITGAVSDSATGNVVIAVNTDVSTLEAGEVIYINTGTGINDYEGSFEVLNVIDANHLLLDLPYNALAAVTGYVNINSLRPYYTFLTKITYKSVITGKTTFIIIKNQPLPNGYCKADMSSFLKSLLQDKDLSDYSQENYLDNQLCQPYTYAHSETWDEQPPIWVAGSYPFYVVFAAKQVSEQYGGNLANYVTLPLAYKLANWLTEFVNPVYRIDQPFDLSFIISEYLSGFTLVANVVLLDINKQPLVNQNILNKYLLDGNGNRIPNGAGGFTLDTTGANQTLVNVAIANNIGLNRLLIDYILPDACYYFSVRIQYTDSGTTYDIMQPLVCRVDQQACINPVYLRWIGLTGSWNYYTFVYNQPVSMDVANVVTLKNFVEDYAAADGVEEVVSKEAVQKMAVMAENVTVDDIKALKSMKFSPKVQMLVNESPIKWQTVIVNTGSFDEYQTLTNEYSFGLSFNLPSFNIQTK